MNAGSRLSHIFSSEEDGSEKILGIAVGNVFLYINQIANFNTE
ncbi:unnamed protein product [marine sediment metagenome]|uniref:Uncharacterized protein n=2 Tax=marine sediment metagenome TaxID=412755 RepID=X0YMQ2_9ZZZZ